MDSSDERNKTEADVVAWERGVAHTEFRRPVTEQAGGDGKYGSNHVSIRVEDDGESRCDDVDNGAHAGQRVSFDFLDSRDNRERECLIHWKHKGIHYISAGGHLRQIYDVLDADVSTLADEHTRCGLQIRVRNANNEEIIDLKLPEGSTLLVSSLGSAAEAVEEVVAASNSYTTAVAFNSAERPSASQHVTPTTIATARSYQGDEDNLHHKLKRKRGHGYVPSSSSAQRESGEAGAEGVVPGLALRGTAADADAAAARRSSSSSSSSSHAAVVTSRSSRSTPRTHCVESGKKVKYDPRDSSRSPVHSDYQYAHTHYDPRGPTTRDPRHRTSTTTSSSRSCRTSRTDRHRPRSRRRRCGDLPLEWWEREEGCKAAKADHMARIDRIMDGDDAGDTGDGRERLVMLTTLYEEDIVLEPNMFPYDCPPGIEHYTLWSVRDLTKAEVQEFVDNWLATHMPHVTRWQYDDNAGERSILLFHVHVFIETRMPRKEAKLVRRKKDALVAPEPTPSLTDTSHEKRPKKSKAEEEDSKMAGDTSHTESKMVVSESSVRLHPENEEEVDVNMDEGDDGGDHDKDDDGDVEADEVDSLCESEYEEYYEYDDQEFTGELLPFFQVDREKEYFPPHMQMK